MKKNEEKLKEIVDSFGRLSFMLETMVKLLQTGDHQEIAKSCLYASLKDSELLVEQLKQIYYEQTQELI